MPEDSATPTVIAAPIMLGLSAASAETIRDFLRSDVADLKRDLADLQRAQGYVTTAIERLGKHIEDIDTIALELLTDCIAVNTDKVIEVVE